MSVENVTAESARDRVLQAAETLLKEEGVYALTLNRILAKAGVSKGGFFHHFPTKEALIRSMLEIGMAKIDEERERLRATGVGATEARLRVTFQQIKSSDSFILVIVAALATDQSLKAAISERVHEAMRVGLDEGLPSDRLRLALLSVQGLFLERLFGVEYSEAELQELEKLVLGLLQPVGA